VFHWPPMAAVGLCRLLIYARRAEYRATVADLNRREFITAGVCVGLSGCRSDLARDVSNSSSLALELSRLERGVGGRLGVFAFFPTIEASEVVAFRADERFAMCSTFKWALAARVLWLADRGKCTLSSHLSFTKADVQEYAPVAQAALLRGEHALSLEAWCDAAVTWSDNTAANLLLNLVGGPAGVNAFFTDSGGRQTRLDRIEPLLNANLLGDTRDTTTPESMARALGTTLTTDLLSSASRQRLVAWMIASPTGKDRLRAGFPTRLRAGDKTGTGENGACNDVAVVWRSTGEPLIVSSYLSESQAPLSELKTVHRGVGKAVSRLL
jgi:beta-lactamase class A